MRAESLYSRRSAVRAVMASAAAFVAITAFTRPTLPLPHLKLVRSSPAADTVLAKSPDAIRLWLSEPADAAVSKITLATSVPDASVSLGKITQDTAKNAPLVAKITTPLPAGAYTVTWKAMSKDGHVVNGTFGFRVGAAK